MATGISLIPFVKAIPLLVISTPEVILLESFVECIRCFPFHSNFLTFCIFLMSFPEDQRFTALRVGMLTTVFWPSAGPNTINNHLRSIAFH